MEDGRVLQINKKILNGTKQGKSIKNYYNWNKCKTYKRGAQKVIKQVMSVTSNQ